MKSLHGTLYRARPRLLLPLEKAYLLELKTRHDETLYWTKSDGSLIIRYNWPSWSFVILRSSGFSSCLDLTCLFFSDSSPSFTKPEFSSFPWSSRIPWPTAQFSHGWSHVSQLAITFPLAILLLFEFSTLKSFSTMFGTMPIVWLVGLIGFFRLLCDE